MKISVTGPRFNIESNDYRWILLEDDNGMEFSGIIYPEFTPMNKDGKKLKEVMDAQSDKFITRVSDDGVTTMESK